MRLKAEFVASETLQQAASNKDKELSEALANKSFMEQKTQVVLISK